MSTNQTGYDYLNAAITRLQQGEWDAETFNLYATAVNTGDLAQDPHALSAAFSGLGLCARHIDTEGQAQEYLEQALSVMPDAPEAYATHYQAGESYFSVDDITRAEPHLAKALELAPEPNRFAPDTNAMLGFCLFQRAHDDLEGPAFYEVMRQAASSFGRALELLDSREYEQFYSDFSFAETKSQALLGLAQCHLGLSLAEPDEVNAARDFIERARRIVEQNQGEIDPAKVQNIRNEAARIRALSR
jgi:tetratricopeptide (TPR) repeat protein